MRTVPTRMGSAQPRPGAHGVPQVQEPLLEQAKALTKNGATDKW